MEIPRSPRGNQFLANRREQQVGSTLFPGDSYLHSLEERAPGEQPEKALLSAILIDAIEILKHDPKGLPNKFQRLRFDALRWVRGEEGAGPHFRFADLCLYLDLPVEATREAILSGGGPRRLRLSAWRS